MEIKGHIKEIGKVTNVTDTFKKRDFVVEYAENPNYPEYIKFELHQDKVNIIDNITEGQEVEVFFNLRGRPWTDRNGKTSYFNTLAAWKVNVLERSGATYGVQSDINTIPQEDDLPF